MYFSRTLPRSRVGVWDRDPSPSLYSLHEGKSRFLTVFGLFCDCFRGFSGRLSRCYAKCGPVLGVESGVVRALDEQEMGVYGLCGRVWYLARVQTEFPNGWAGLAGMNPEVCGERLGHIFVGVNMNWTDSLKSVGLGSVLACQRQYSSPSL